MIHAKLILILSPSEACRQLNKVVICANKSFPSIHWSVLVTIDSPSHAAAVSECQNRLEPIFQEFFLDVMTDKGWKVSFYVGYLCVMFPCNISSYRKQLQNLAFWKFGSILFCDGEGTDCCFKDAAVLTQNRQFSLPLNLPSSLTAFQFGLVCVLYKRLGIYSIGSTGPAQLGLVHNSALQIMSAAG